MEAEVQQLANARARQTHTLTCHTAAHATLAQGVGFMVNTPTQHFRLLMS